MNNSIENISIYLKELDEKVKLNSSNIKQLITDLPKSLFPNPKLSSTQILLFSKIIENDERIRLCRLLEILIQRIVVSARRSNQAFTSLWDGIKKCLLLILEDALGLENREPFLNVLLRQILQLGIAPSKSINIKIKNTIDENWLAMDLDVQLNLNQNHKVKKFFTVKIEENITNDLDAKTLCMYCKTFNVQKEFLDIYIKLPNPSKEIHNLFFTKYFNVDTAAEFIGREHHDKHQQCLPIEFITGLLVIKSSEWLKFNSETLKTLVCKLKTILEDKSLVDLSLNTKTKETRIIFELLTEITMSLEFRTDVDDVVVINDLNFQIINNFDISILPDLALSKYWYFVSALLSEHIEEIFIDLNIIYTLTLPEGSFFKSKASVCRVISLYWSKLNSSKKNQILRILLNSVVRSDNNKFRWNVAVVLMNIESSMVSKEYFEHVKNIWMGELKIKGGNFKVILSFTKVLLKWSHETDYQIISDSKDLEIIWATSSRLKLFIKENYDNLEFEEEADGHGNDLNEKLVETGQKLEEMLNKLMVDSDWFRGSK